MKASKSRWLFLVACGLWLLGGCDTPGNVISPVSSYFLKYFGQEGSQTGVDFEVNPDGTLILLGTTQKTKESYSKLFVVKSDPQGNVIWADTLPTLAGTYGEEARDIELATGGRIVIVGNSFKNLPNDPVVSRDIHIITLAEADGALINSAPFSYTDVNGAPADDDASTVTQTNDGFIIAGSSGNLVHPPPGGASFKRDALFIRCNDDLSPYATSWPTTPAYGQSYENGTTKIIQQPTSAFTVFGSCKYSKSSGSNTIDFNFWYFALDSLGVPGHKGGNTDVQNTLGSATNLDEKLKSVASIPAAFGGGFLLGGIETDPAGNSSIYVARLRNPPSYDGTDIQIQTALGNALGQIKDERVSVFPSVNSQSGFILTNEASNQNSNLLLTKFTLDPNPVPIFTVVFGGDGDDFAGAIRELPDGRIVVLGTMAIGGLGGETKMVLIKVNKDGQFSE
jgi:hypothetical protein